MNWAETNVKRRMVARWYTHNCRLIPLHLSYRLFVKKGEICLPLEVVQHFAFRTNHLRYLQLFRTRMVGCNFFSGYRLFADAGHRTCSRMPRTTPNLSSLLHTVVQMSTSQLALGDWKDEESQYALIACEMSDISAFFMVNETMSSHAGGGVRPFRRFSHRMCKRSIVCSLSLRTHCVWSLKYWCVALVLAQANSICCKKQRVSHITPHDV